MTPATGTPTPPPIVGTCFAITRRLKVANSKPQEGNSRISEHSKTEHQTKIVPCSNSPLEGYAKRGVGALISDAPSWASDSLFPYWLLPENTALRDRSRALRKQGILTEVIFWQMLSNKVDLGWDIDRQVVIDNYIVDFFIPELGLVFEIDGSSHEGREDYDAERDAVLSGYGLQVIHISANDIGSYPEGVSHLVYASIAKRKTELSSNSPK